MLNAARMFLRQILLPRLRQAARDLWEDIRDWIDALLLGLRFAATRSPRPKVLLYFGFAVGDDLLCTSVLRELRQRGRDPLLMVSDHRELFVGNGDPTYVRPLWRRYSRDRSTVAICRRLAQLWGGEFTRLEYAPLAGDDRSRPPSRHIIAEMCARARITGPVAIKPYFSLTAAEKAAAAWAGGRIVIQSSGMGARHPIRNKQWYEDRFQGVVDALRGEAEFIQLGAATDAPLPRPRICGEQPRSGRPQPSCIMRGFTSVRSGF